MRVIQASSYTTDNSPFDRIFIHFDLVDWES